LKTLHEEADTMIVSQMLAAVKHEGFTRIHVLCADTDVFVILLYHFQKEKLFLMRPTVEILMQNPSSTPTKAISISDTYDSIPSHLVSSLIAAHALSGCDTVPQMFGIAKKKVINLLKSNKEICLLLDQIGNIDPAVPCSTIQTIGVQFVQALFSKEKGVSLGDIRYQKWMEKAKNKSMDSPAQLRYLPPTLDALSLNIKRAHLQASIWKNVTKENVNELEPELFGWTKDSVNKCLEPAYLPSDMPIAPECLMKVTYCGCCSNNPCSTQRCGCKKAEVRCTVLCKCQGKCCNGEPTDLDNIDIDNNEDSGDSDDDDDDYDSEYDDETDCD
jgi:hypothetical protein